MRFFPIFPSISLGWHRRLKASGNLLPPLGLSDIEADNAWAWGWCQLRCGLWTLDVAFACPMLSLKRLTRCQCHEPILYWEVVPSVWTQDPKMASVCKCKNMPKKHEEIKYSRMLSRITEILVINVNTFSIFSRKYLQDSKTPPTLVTDKLWCSSPSTT